MASYEISQRHNDKTTEKREIFNPDHNILLHIRQNTIIEVFSNDIAQRPSSKKS